LAVRGFVRGCSERVLHSAAIANGPLRRIMGANTGEDRSDLTIDVIAMSECPPPAVLLPVPQFAVGGAQRLQDGGDVTRQWVVFGGADGQIT
jgi:hypothetical protein